MKADIKSKHKQRGWYLTDSKTGQDILEWDGIWHHSGRNVVFLKGKHSVDGVSFSDMHSS